MNIHNVIHIYCTHNILENMKNGYIYICIVFSTLFSLNIHFRCLNTYFFVTKCFMGLTQSSVAIKCIYL